MIKLMIGLLVVCAVLAGLGYALKPDAEYVAPYRPHGKLVRV
jgi:hypothetical protein